MSRRFTVLIMQACLYYLFFIISFIMIGLLLREALDRLRVRLNMYLVIQHSVTNLGVESGEGATPHPQHINITIKHSNNTLLSLHVYLCKTIAPRELDVSQIYLTTVQLQLHQADYSTDL